MGEVRHLYIESLKWRNRGNAHQARGRINLDNAEVHSAELIANFETNGGFKDISGDFYLEVNDLQVNNWLQPLVADIKWLMQSPWHGSEAHSATRLLLYHVWLYLIC